MIAGFVLMVFEIAAARILAPTIGSSNYVWTSVIGVIIMALSVGYWAGGRIADMRHTPRDLAWLFVVLSGVISTTVIVYPGVLAAIATWTIDIRLCAVVASLVLFAPASFVLGMINPYLAKLNVQSLASSGSAIANLGALNSVGGIVGTFLTGFVLFGVMGVRGVLVLLAVGSMIVGGLIVRERTVKLTAALAVALVLCLMAWASPSTGRTVDTQIAHYVIEDSAVSDLTLRTLATGPGGRQSGVVLEMPNELAFWYTHQIASVIEAQPTKQRIAILGAGAYTLPAYLAAKYPTAQIDVVDIDPALVDIAEQYFGYTGAENIRHVTADARTFINQTTQPYDIVVVDVFGDDAIPETLMTAEYGRALRRAVASSGAVITNMIAGHTGACGRLFQAEVRPYLDNFLVGHALVRYPDEQRSNIIAIFGVQPVVPEGYRLLKAVSGPAYTDDYNPVAQLQFDCRRS